MNEQNIPTAPEQSAPAAPETAAPRAPAEEAVTVGALRCAIERKAQQRARRAAEESAARWSREADDRADVRAAFTVAVTGLRQLAAAYPGHVAEDTGRVPAQETKPNGSAAAGRCPGAVPGSGQQRKKET